jgi:guanosine-3',5'-bis(diphosphate) 3'-pyrophosphohydrolase
VTVDRGPDFRSQDYEACELLARATIFAMKCHAGKKRRENKAAVPYLVHPLRVSELLRRVARIEDPEVLAAAVLHDVIEDSGVRFDEVAALAGERVAKIVAELTNDSRLPKPQRHADMFRRLAHASWEAKLIKLADRLDNLRHPGDWSPEKQQDFGRESRELLALLAGTCPSLEEEIAKLLRHA